MKFKSLTVALVACGLLSGCANQLIRSDAENEALKEDLSVKLGTFTVEEAKQRGPIELPANYSADNYKRMKLAVSFRMLDADDIQKFAKQTSQTLSAQFESEMSKLGRFVILSRSDLGQLAIADEKRFQDKGMIDPTTRMRLGKQLGADYALAAGITLQSEKYNRRSHYEMFVNVLVTYQLINLTTGEVEDADTAQGKAIRTFYQTPSGKFIGGFNVKNPQDATNAINEASIRALISIANKLGNKFPVGGRVMGGFGDMAQVEGGKKAGIVDSQVGVMYSNVYGVDVPLAYVNMVPSNTSTQVRILRWSDDDHAEKLVDQYKKDPNAFTREFDTYCVTKSMPMPKDWQKYM